MWIFATTNIFPIKIIKNKIKNNMWILEEKNKIFFGVDRVLNME